MVYTYKNGLPVAIGDAVAWYQEPTVRFGTVSGQGEGGAIVSVERDFMRNGTAVQAGSVVEIASWALIPVDRNPPNPWSLEAQRNRRPAAAPNIYEALDQHYGSKQGFLDTLDKGEKVFWRGGR